MERKHTALWIFVALVALTMAACCAILVVGAAAAPWWAGWLPTWSFRGPDWDPADLPWRDAAGRNAERTEETFDVGSAPSLQIEHYAGSISISPSDGTTIRVIATRQARSQRDLDRVQVQISRQGDGLLIRTRAPGVNNTSVKLEIWAPVDTRLDLSCGAGSIEIVGLHGAMEVDVGAGSLAFRDVAGPVDAHTGAGSIDYEGRPAGSCRFGTGAGSITLRVPSDLNMTVDFAAGVGGIHSSFPVNGISTRHRLSGTIGTGSEGTLKANAGVGSIELLRS